MGDAGPMEIVCIDFLFFQPGEAISNVLVVTDRYTSYAQAYPICDQRAITITKTNSLCTMAYQREFIQVKEVIFRASVFINCSLGVQKNHTESFNRTHLDMLGTL